MWQCGTISRQGRAWPPTHSCLQCLCELDATCNAARVCSSSPTLALLLFSVIRLTICNHTVAWDRLQALEGKAPTRSCLQCWCVLAATWNTARVRSSSPTQAMLQFFCDQTNHLQPYSSLGSVAGTGGQGSHSLRSAMLVCFGCHVEHGTSPQVITNSSNAAVVCEQAMHLQPYSSIESFVIKLCTCNQAAVWGHFQAGEGTASHSFMSVMLFIILYFVIKM